MSAMLGSKDNPFPDVYAAAETIKRFENSIVADRKRSGLIMNVPSSAQFAPFGFPTGAYDLSQYDTNAFIVSKTAPDRTNPYVPKDGARYFYKFKPNLWNRTFLYRGQNGDFIPCKPSLFRDPEKQYYLDDCIETDEFQLLVMSLPLCRLLMSEGVRLGKRTYYFGIDLYGLSQHYGNRTSLLDLTSDMDAAVFFACTTFDSNTFQYKALGQDHIEKNPLGVLYAYDLVVPDYAMSAYGDGTRLSAIGKQLFKNPGSQSGFMLDVPKDLSFDDLVFKLPKPIEDSDSIKRVYKFYFRHNVEVSRKVMKYSDYGSVYFPGDILQKHWNLRKSEQNTRNEKSVSLSAVKENVKANPPETVESISTKLIRDYGYTIIDKTPSFTPEELHDFYYELNNGGWDAFCADMVFPGSDGQRYWNDFHDLPTVDEYKHFFKPD